MSDPFEQSDFIRNSPEIKRTLKTTLIRERTTNRKVAGAQPRPRDISCSATEEEEIHLRRREEPPDAEGGNDAALVSRQNHFLTVERRQR